MALFFLIRFEEEKSKGESLSENIKIGLEYIRCCEHKENMPRIIIMFNCRPWQTYKNNYRLKRGMLLRPRVMCRVTIT